MNEKLGDRYQIIGELGRGGMGVVYRAKDELLHREVAIKQLSLDLGDEAVLGRDQALQRFLIEARAAANLQHPNVVTLFDVVDAHPPYIVMEYVEGETLRDIVEGSGPLTLKDACVYVEAMCRGLTAAHDRGMVHRDIKPENVMVTGGTAKVLDFGLAQIPLGKKAQENEPLLGTPGYMAPEQIMGEKATAASDVFAVACVFIFTITGEDPFKGATVKEILTKSVKEDLDLSELPIGAGLRPKLTAAMSKAPGDRPTAAEFGDTMNLGQTESIDRYSSFMAEEDEAELPPGWAVPPPADPAANSSDTIEGLLASMSTESPPPPVIPQAPPGGFAGVPEVAPSGGPVPPAVMPGMAPQANASPSLGAAPGGAVHRGQVGVSGAAGYAPGPAQHGAPARATAPPPVIQDSAGSRPNWGTGAKSAGRSIGGAGPGAGGGARRLIIAGVAVAIVVIIIVLLIIK